MVKRAGSGGVPGKRVAGDAAAWSSREPPVSFRDAELSAALDARRQGQASRGDVAKRDLGRAYWLLARTLERLNLSETEASLVCAALRGAQLTPQELPQLWTIVDGYLSRQGRGAPTPAGHPQLVERLRALAPLEAWAIADAVERFWIGAGARGTTTAALARVGLVH